MGVCNVTPDSFSDGGKFLEPAAALAELRRISAAGAHIADIGGEATGPKSRPIPAEEEIARIAPILEAAAGEAPIPISVDTYKAKTARFALERGAKMINDVSALRAEPELADAVRDHAAFLVMMFAKGRGPLPHANEEPAAFKDVVEDVAAFLSRRIELAVKCGVPENRIIVDPGMGKFLSNDAEDSWRLLSRLDELCEKLRPFPVLIGTSRKGFLGGKLADRDPISQLTALEAVEKGAQIIRTHRPDMAQDFLAVLKHLKTR